MQPAGHNFDLIKFPYADEWFPRPQSPTMFQGLFYIPKSNNANSCPATCYDVSADPNVCREPDIGKNEELHAPSQNNNTTEVVPTNDVSLIITPNVSDVVQSEAQLFLNF